MVGKKGREDDEERKRKKKAQGEWCFERKKEGSVTRLVLGRLAAADDELVVLASGLGICQAGRGEVLGGPERRASVRDSRHRWHDSVCCIWLSDCRCALLLLNRPQGLLRERGALRPHLEGVVVFVDW